MKRIKRLLACTLIAALCIGFGAMSASAQNTNINLDKSYSTYVGSWGLMEYTPKSGSTIPAKARTAVEVEIDDIGIVEAQVFCQGGTGGLVLQNMRGGYSGFFYSAWAKGIAGSSIQRVYHHGEYTSQLDSYQDYFTYNFV